MWLSRLGLEWSYGKTFTASRPGVFGLPLGEDCNHRFRERIFLGDMKLSVDFTNAVLRDITDDYPGQGYDVLHRNCCHCSEDLCERLGVDPLPDYISCFTRVGASMEDSVKENAGNRQALASRRPEEKKKPASKSKKCGEKRQQASKGKPIPGSFRFPKVLHALSSSCDCACRSS